MRNRLEVCLKQITIQPQADDELTSATLNTCLWRDSKSGSTDGRRKNTYQAPTGQKRKKHQQAKIRSAQGGYPIGFAKQGTRPHRIIQTAQQAVRKQVRWKYKLVWRNR